MFGFGFLSFFFFLVFWQFEFAFFYIGLFVIDLKFLFLLMQQLGLMLKQFSITTSSFKSGIWVISVSLCFIFQSCKANPVNIVCVFAYIVNSSCLLHY